MKWSEPYFNIDNTTQNHPIINIISFDESNSRPWMNNMWDQLTNLISVFCRKFNLNIFLPFFYSRIDARILISIYSTGKTWVDLWNTLFSFVSYLVNFISTSHTITFIIAQMVMKSFGCLMRCFRNYAYASYQGSNLSWRNAGPVSVAFDVKINVDIHSGFFPSSSSSVGSSLHVWMATNKMSKK